MEPMTLKDYRLAAGFKSQRAAAVAAGVRDGDICAWETGIRGMSADAINKLAKTYGISIEKVFWAPKRK